MHCALFHSVDILRDTGVKMRTEYIFPTVLIALDVCAAVPYAVRGNLRMMVYWLAAATLTACVTYTGGRA